MDLDDEDRAIIAQETIETLNPHFLFNALSAIRASQLISPEKAGNMLCCFSDYLRARMRSAALCHPPISFEDELLSVKAYISLEMPRMGKRLRFLQDIQCTDFLLPALSVLEFVEIMVRKIIFHSGKDGGTLSIHTWAEGSRRFVELSCAGGELRPEDKELLDTQLEGLKLRCGMNNVQQTVFNNCLIITLNFDAGCKT